MATMASMTPPLQPSRSSNSKQIPKASTDFGRSWSALLETFEGHLKELQRPLEQMRPRSVRGLSLSTGLLSRAESITRRFHGEKKPCVSKGPTPTLRFLRFDHGGFAFECLQIHDPDVVGAIAALETPLLLASRHQTQGGGVPMP